MSLNQRIGSDRTYTLPLTTEEGAAFTPTGHVLTFTAKRNKDDADTDAVFQKVTGAGLTHSGTNALLRVLRADTLALEPCTLYCDIQAKNQETGDVIYVWEDWMKLARPITRLTETSVDVNSESAPLPASVTAAFDGATEVVAAGIAGTEKVILKGASGLLKATLTEIKNWLRANFTFYPVIGSGATEAVAGNDTRLHAAATVTGNGLQISGQQISLKFGTGSTEIAVGDHNHSGVYDTFGASYSAVSAHVSEEDPHGDRAYADSLVTGMFDDRGAFDASVNTWPTTGGSGPSGAILKGDIWTIEVVATSGPLLGYNLSNFVRALVDNPGQTDANWNVSQVGYGYTPENAANKETSLTTDSDTKYPSSKCIADFLASTYVPLSSITTNILSFGSGDFATAAQGAQAELIEIQLAASDETSALTTGDGKVVFRAPCAFRLTDIRASVTAAPTGALLLAQIRNAGNDVLSTRVSIDATEKTSVWAATPPVINATYRDFADDAEIHVDLDQVGSTIAGAGLKITLLGTRL